MDCPPQKSGRTWSYVEQPAQQTSQLRESWSEGKKNWRGWGKGDVNLENLRSQTSLSISKDPQLMFSLDLFSLYTCCFFAERSSMSSLLHNVHCILCDKRNIYPASSSSMRYLKVLRQVKICDFIYLYCSSIGSVYLKIESVHGRTATRCKFFKTDSIRRQESLT